MPTLNYYLNALGRCGNLFRSHRLQGTGVDSGDMPYLFFVCRHPGETQDAIGKALYVHKCRVTRHITRLETQGYLSRTPDPSDKRALLVYPTQKALDLLPLLREVNAAFQAALSADFTEQESEQFVSLLSRALQNARLAVDGEELISGKEGGK